jgi:hypothetical protein
MKLIKDLGLIYASKNSKQKTRHGIYLCPACDKEFTANTNNVNYGKTTRCRKCHSSKRCNIRSHKWYQMWANQKHRCNNKNNRDYANYGGRGIKFSSEFDIVENWIMYVGSLENSGKKGYTLDRIDNDGDYEKGNLRWASKSQQNTNKRKPKGRTSNFRGVYYRRDTGRFVASIKHNGRKVHIINTFDELEAAKAYDEYVVRNSLDQWLNFNNEEK